MNEPQLLDEVEDFLLGPDWSLADMIDHLLHRGVVVSGSVTISVAGIDLMYLGLQVVLASVESLTHPREDAA